MKKYYLSKYLVFVELEDSCIVFSGSSGNMDVLSAGFAGKLKETGPGKELDFLAPGELEFLRQRGHVTDLPPEAERAAFRKLAEQLHRRECTENVKSGFLSLLMSYDCNLACPYCYQNGTRSRKGPARMSEEFLKSVLTKHYDALFPGVAPANLGISLYGGEPFLRPNRPLIKLVAEFAGRHGTRLSSISNSVDIEAVKDLLGPQPGMINEVQVTMDTSKEGRELPRSKGGRFAPILENVHFMLDRKVRVSIRMHISGDNYDELNEAVDYLIEQEILGHPRAFAYLAPIREHQDPAVKDQYLDISGPAAKEISRKLGHPLHLSYDSVKGLLSLREGRLKRTHFCMLSRPTNHVIDPFQDLYGCYEEAGQEEVRTGHIDRDRVVFFPMREVYNERYVHNLEKCLDCPYALLCGGGCPYHARRLHGSVMEPDCFDLKDSIRESIRYVYLAGRRVRQSRLGA